VALVVRDLSVALLENWLQGEMVSMAIFVEFAQMGTNDVAINPRYVTTVEPSNMSGYCTVMMVDGTKRTVEGSLDEVVAKLKVKKALEG